ncbi:MAG: MFS transporter [Pseudomonadota bacterium]|nr:MFS transporter [Pseudomonadota bacterium]
MNDPSSPVPRFDSLPRLAYVNGLFIIGTLGTLIAPAMLEGWSHLHWRPTQLGLVAAIELAGLAVGSFSGLYWQQRWRWRATALAALLVAIASNAACMVVKDYAAVCVLRGLVGVSSGLLAALYSAVLANSRSPGRIIAVTTFIQIGVEAAFTLSTTSVFEHLGSSGLFMLMGALFAALLPFLSLLPPAWPAAPSAVREAQSMRTSRRAYPLLLSFIPFILVQTGVYTFLGEFGRVAAHLTVDATMRAIGTSVVLSSLGSVAAYALNDRIGLRLPIGGAILLMTAMLLGMILGSRSAVLFLVYISLLQIGWIFLNCYLYSALIDANNLLVPAATPLSTFGSVIGASAMGYVLDHGGLTGALVLAVGSMLLTALLTMPFLRARAAATAPRGGHAANA